MHGFMALRARQLDIMEKIIAIIDRYGLEHFAYTQNMRHRNLRLSTFPGRRRQQTKQIVALECT